MGETLDAEYVAAFEPHGPVDRVVAAAAGLLPDVVVEGGLADDAEAVVRGDVFDFDVGGGEEEVELGGGFFEFGEGGW